MPPEAFNRAVGAALGAEALPCPVVIGAARPPDPSAQPTASGRFRPLLAPYALPLTRPPLDPYPQRERSAHLEPIPRTPKACG